MLDVMRSETKYLLSRNAAARLQDKLAVFMTPDSYSGRKPYRIRSLYFDTPDGGDAFDKDVGAYYRRKIRLRIYDTAQERAKLEHKEKAGSSQRKKSVWVSKALCNRLAKGDLSVLYGQNNDFLNEMYLLMTTGGYRPSVVVEYDRLAFTYPLGDIRITFDSGVRACRSSFDLFDPNMTFQEVYPDVVMEVKYSGFYPEFLAALLGDFDPVRDSVSKYYLSFDAFD